MNVVTPRILRRALDRLYEISGALAALCLAAICVVMLAQSFGREIGFLVRGADDITAWLTAASAFLALGHTFRHGELVRVGLWIDKLKGESRRRAEILALSITALFVGYMLWAVVEVRLRKLEVQRSRPGPHQDSDLDSAAELRARRADFLHRGGRRMDCCGARTQTGLSDRGGRAPRSGRFL